MAPRDLDRLLSSYLVREGEMTAVERKACDDRHEAESDLLESKLAIVGKDVSSVESRIKIWVLVGLFTLAMFIAGATATSLIKIGNYQEKVDRIEERQGEFDDLRKSLQDLQKSVDELRWRLMHQGEPPWQIQPSR